MLRRALRTIARTPPPRRARRGLRLSSSLPLLGALVLALPGAGHAQSLKQLIAAGDSAYTTRRAPLALKDYLAAVALDSTDAGALWRASRSEAELALFDTDTARARQLLASAERHGRAAVAHAPRSADAHFALAEALGRIALRTPLLSRLPYATEVHTEARACLALDRKSAPCLHVLGLWDAEYMRLGHYSRQMADMMTGGKLFANATWAHAEENLRAAIALDPHRAIHHFDLAQVYLDQRKADSARTELHAVLGSRLEYYNDPEFQARAKATLDSLAAARKADGQ